MKSLPAWECGLKRPHFIVSNYLCVTPRVGVWIETLKTGTNNPGAIVTPRVGVWIETTTKTGVSGVMSCHSPRGSVD